MALTDTALATVQETLADVVGVAAESLDTVGATLRGAADEKRSHKGRLILLILLVLAVAGVIAWKKSSRSSEPEPA